MRPNSPAGKEVNMDNPRYCAECDEIAAQIRAAFIKVIDKRSPEGDLRSRKDFVQFLSNLFASEPDLARLSDQWDPSGVGTAQHRWMEHRIATGHTPAPLSSRN